MAISRQTWATVLFWVVVAVVAAVTVQQWVGLPGAGGDPYTRVLSIAIPMAFPVGLAYWGKRTGQVGPALGALSLIALLWVALMLGGGE